MQPKLGGTSVQISKENSYKIAVITQVDDVKCC